MTTFRTRTKTVLDAMRWLPTVALLLSTAAGAQGAPPAPPRPSQPAPAPRPVLAPSPLGVTLSGNLDALRALEMMDVDAIRSEAMAAAMAAQSIAPRVVMELDLAQVRAQVDEMKLASTLSGQVSAQMAREASMAAREAVERAREGITSWQFDFAPAPFASFSGRTIRSQAPAPWASDDQADSLYREARRALSNDSYSRAATLFRQIRTQYPKSTYTPDSYYWEAFALQRLGGESELRSALAALEAQQQQYPKASTRGDAASLRTRIEGLLARNGDQQAIARLTDRAITSTQDGCPRARDDERIDALNAVAQIDAAQAMPILKKQLARREPCTKELRKTAVWLIASKRQPEAASILLNVAKTDPDKDVREQAVFWMSNVPTDEAVTMLIDLARNGDDLDLRKRAVYSLSRSKSPRAATTLREVALDGNADVSLRGDALTWYMSGPGKESGDSFTFLKDVYGRADDHRFKQRVLSSIRQLKTDESRSFLVDVAQNSRESIEIRRYAVSMLSGAGLTNAQLAQIYDRNSEVEIRKYLISALSSMRDNGGIEKLLDIARNEKNTELRKQAISSLTRTKDPRALQLLTEIIDR